MNINQHAGTMHLEMLLSTKGWGMDDVETLNTLMNSVENHLVDNMGSIIDGFTVFKHSVKHGFLFTKVNIRMDATWDEPILTCGNKQLDDWYNFILRAPEHKSTQMNNLRAIVDTGVVLQSDNTQFNNKHFLVFTTLNSRKEIITMNAHSDNSISDIHDDVVLFPCSVLDLHQREKMLAPM